MPRKPTLLFGKAWQNFKRDVNANPKRIGKKLVVIQGAEHKRLYPPRISSNDEKQGFRIDYGSVCRTNPNILKVILQINKNAKSSALQDALKRAPRGSHTILAEAKIDVRKNDVEKCEDMVEQLEAGLENWRDKDSWTAVFPVIIDVWLIAFYIELIYLFGAILLHDFLSRMENGRFKSAFNAS